MDLSQLLSKDPVIILAIALLFLIATLNSLVSLATKVIQWVMERRKRNNSIDDTQEIDPNIELMNAVKSLVVTIQLLIETNNQRDSAAALRDSRIGNLADSVGEQTKALGELAQSIGQLASTGNNQSIQLAQQNLKLTELTGRIGYANQMGEDTRTDLTKAVQAVDEQHKAIDAQTKRIGELKDQVEKLEKDVREEFLPLLQGIRTALDGLATKADLVQIGEFSTKLNLIEAEVKALIVTMAVSKPSVPQDTPAPAPPSAVVDTHEAQPAPKEEKPNVPPSIA